MLRKLIFPIVLGVAGCATLISLGNWQVQRLAWKEGVLAQIDARLQSDPAPFSTDVTEEADEYSRVTVQGTPTGDELHVLVSGTTAGTGYRVISRFETDLGPILLDQGLLALEDKDLPAPSGPIEIKGTLLWPDDLNNSTPDPDLAANIWFARNVETMSAHLDTLPFMVVVSDARPADPRLTPLPVTTAAIKNDHLEYAITWFLLAAVWAIMSLYLIGRTLRQKQTDD